MDKAALIASLLMFICIASEAQTDNKFISVKDDKFIDPEGRQIILHGVNIVEKSKGRNYLSWHGPEEFAMMRDWGFNCIRLGIIWDGLEPEPGKYDYDYLAGLDSRIQWAKDNGIYVFLDMHQDLYNAKFGGDGAPEWAVLDDGKPHINPGGVWSIAYFTSPAIHAAFDNFWANKPASDGIGLQDHFARAWQIVAQRYADEPTVIGYDLFNEPFPGSSILPSLMEKLQSAIEFYAQKYGTEKPDISEIMSLFGDPENLKKYSDDFDVYKAFVDGGLSYSQGFEGDLLMPFYNRVVNAIRQVDKNHIIFLETHIYCNAGTPTGITPVIDPDGNPDLLQAIAPHGYDLVIDTEKVAEHNPDRVKLIFERHAETSKRLNIPTLIGEWGAFYGHPGTLPAAKMVVHQLEKHLFSDTYWSYGSSKEIDKAVYFPFLSRPYPSVVSGKLIKYQTDLDKQEFHCIWEESPSIDAPNMIYIPSQWFPNGYSVELEPKASGCSFKPIIEGSSSGYLIIPTTGQKIERRLLIKQ